MAIFAKIVPVQGQFSVATDADSPEIVAATEAEVKKLFDAAVGAEEVVWLEPKQSYSVDPKPLI